MIKDLLRFFNINLFSMANYLEVSVDTIKSMNSGRRNFTAQHIRWLQVLKEALQLQTSSDQLPEVEISKALGLKDFNQALQKYICKQTGLIARKKAELEQFKSKYSDLKRGLYACQKLLKAGVLNPNHQKWLDLRKRHLSQKLQELQLKIALHEAQISGLQIQIEDLEKAVNANQWLK